MSGDSNGNAGDLGVIALFGPTRCIGVESLCVASDEVLAVLDCHGSRNASDENGEFVCGRRIVPPVRILSLDGVVESLKAFHRQIVWTLFAVEGVI